MLTRWKGLLSALLSLSLCLLAGQAAAQVCVTCRAEGCEEKPSLRKAPWCGKGADPLKAKRSPRVRPQPALEAKKPASEPPVKESTPVTPTPTTEPAQPSAPPPVAPPASELATAPPPAATAKIPPPQPEKRGRPLRVAASVLLGLGLPAAAAGGALVGIDSRPACGAADPRECEFLHDTLPGGAALLAAGGAAVVTSVVLFVLDSRPARPLSSRSTRP